ncbi:MAG: hypothetical protein M1834_008547 [Cirrosporium novae-zelandiae]|nr:MAG: hypothetical protein M1834_008547 [Cirrosporium novae-zelandiae]
MTDLLHVLPSLDPTLYTHLLPSLEAYCITTSDLLTLSHVEIAKRAHVPPLGVRKLAEHVLRSLQSELGVETIEAGCDDQAVKGNKQSGSSANELLLYQSGNHMLQRWNTVSTLDPTIDTALGGGIPTGYITEITGESASGKTLFLLHLLLSSQLPPSHGGLSRPSAYLSTEASLPTKRVAQLLNSHPVLSSFPKSEKDSPSLKRIWTLKATDLEYQSHILTYQLPVLLSRENIGVLVIDSIAANFRGELSTSTGSVMARRSQALVETGATLRKLARDYNVAIVVANQVSDRFDTIPLIGSGFANRSPRRLDLDVSPSPVPLAPQPSYSPSPIGTPVSTQAPAAMTFNHQLRFFSGWGDNPSLNTICNIHTSNFNMKTPSLGLVWANQIACRIAMIKEQVIPYEELEEGKPTRYHRTIRVAFSSWAKGSSRECKDEHPTDGTGEVEFEIWEGGIRSISDHLIVKETMNQDQSEVRTVRDNTFS